VDEGIALTATLNKTLAPIETEFEKYADSLFLKAKNRYAGKIVWEGEWFDEPDYYIKGIELIQARMPKVMKTALKDALMGMLDGSKESVITERLTTLISKYLDGENVEDLLMKTTLKKNLWDYKVLSGPSAGADWALLNLDWEFSQGDDMLLALNTSGEYVAFPDITWLPKVMEKTDLGYYVMVERFVVNKAKDLYEAVGWDYQQLMNALEGKEAIEWV